MLGDVRIFGDVIDVGYIVDDLVVTGPSRGTYKVWIPRKHWQPSNDDFTGFGSNLNNLSMGDLEQARNSAESFYPAFPLQSGGAMPLDEETGLISTDEANPEINADTVPNISSNGNVSQKKSYHPSGSGSNFKLRHSEGASSMLQTYVLSGRTGVNANTRNNAPRGCMAKLSIGTKVLVIGNYIIGMLPDTQNDWINQFAPLNQSY